MIVLKATQDKVLAILQSVADIVERRHTFPILAHVLIRRNSHPVTLHSETLPPAQAVQTRHSAEASTLLTQRKHSLVLHLPRTSYFDSKVNGRNAP